MEEIAEARNEPSTEPEDHLRAFIARSTWRYARTLPRHPHEYTLRAWHDPAEFDRIVTLIRKRGAPGEYLGRRYLYLTIDGHRYWTMGAPVGETILIDRAANESAPGPPDS